MMIAIRKAKAAAIAARSSMEGVEGIILDGMVLDMAASSCLAP
jgi:hypothetical protein